MVKIRLNFIQTLFSGDKVLLVDDLLATGGTIEATAKLVAKLGGNATDAAFVVSLPELGGEITCC